MHLNFDIFGTQRNFDSNYCDQVFHITCDTLEERLLYDDVFVDYFNAFLQLRAFLLPMRYEKLDGFYLDNTDNEDSDFRQLVDERGKFHWQGAITNWIKQHRLPYFLRSHLFLEYKLCKLLLRKLLEGSRGGAQSQLGLGGYSVVDSPQPLPSTPASGKTSRVSWPGKYTGRQYYHRPLGSATSLPAMISTALETRLKLLEELPVTKECTSTTAGDCMVPSNGQQLDTVGECIDRTQVTMSARSRRVRNNRRTSLFTPFLDKLSSEKRDKSGRRRTRSAPVKTGTAVVGPNHTEDFSNNDNDLQSDEETILDFEEEDENEAEMELQNMVDERKRNLQEMKEDALNSTLGMENFREFLKETSGIHLFDFWINVERYKDLEIHGYDSEHSLKLLKMHLFREINEKYKNYLTTDAKRKLTEALNNDGLTSEILTRIQYDMLRRLRSYWIPRFVVHEEKSGKKLVLSQDRKDSRCATALSFLPAISIVHSLPARGDWCVEVARRSCDWSKNLVLTKRRVRSPLKRTSTLSDYDKFALAISLEKDAGWPFRSFLERFDKRTMLTNLLFWQSIEDFKMDEIRGCDRYLHLCNAWSIVKQFLSDEAEISIDLDKQERENISEKLRDAVEVSSTLFRPAQAEVLNKLQISWEEYVENDKDSLLKVVKVPSASHSSSASRANVKNALYYRGLFSSGKWYPSYPESSPSERQRRLHTALTVAENIEATRQSLRSSPQKSLASTTPKGKSAKKKQKPMKTTSKEKKKNMEKEKEEEEDETPLPQFTDVLEDKTTMDSFKHYIQNAEGRNAMNTLSMFLDIETYKTIPSSRKAERTELATQIYRDFFDQSSRKNVDLPPRIPYHVENECPSTGILVEAQQYILPDIQTCFQDFYKHQEEIKPAAETTTNKQSTTTTTNNKTAPTNHQPTNYLMYYKRRRNKFRGPGRLQPSKEDRVSFAKELRDTYGKFSVTLELFRRYLEKNDDIQGDSVSKLENDLLFYVQVQKFKDLFQYMDDTTIVKKADAIVDCFLDSASPPSVQIDISSELAYRIVQKAQALHTRTKLSREQRDVQIFDEAQNSVMKELLPFWAGFTRQHNSAEEPEMELPPTRRETIVKRRYSEYKKFPLKKPPTNLRSVLPSIGESRRELNFSISDGLAWKEDSSMADVPNSVFSGDVQGSTRSDTRDTTRSQPIRTN